MYLSRRPKQLLLLFGDIIVLVLCGLLGTVVLGISVGPFLWGLFMSAYIGMAYTAGLFSVELAFGRHFTGLRLSFCLVFALLGVVAGAFIFLGFIPELVDLFLPALAVVLLVAWRGVIASLAASSRFRTRVAFIGKIPGAAEIVSEMEKRPGLGWDPILSWGTLEFPTNLAVPSLDRFLSEIAGRKVDLIVVGESSSLGESAKIALFELLSRKLRFFSVPDFFEAVARRVPIGLIDELWFLENIDLKRRRWYAFFKRILDLVAGLSVFLVSLPIWPFIAAAVKASSPGPVFFTQIRLGRNGKHFRMIKFRTMRTTGNSFAPTAKGGDPRITRVGAFLRSSRLDELPQIINVLLGDMSFIGPRPERPELAANLEKEVPYFRQRLLVKPGLTGWDQVSGEYHSPSVSDTFLKLQYDLYYIKYMSPALDGSIFFKTIMTVLSRAGV